MSAVEYGSDEYYEETGKNGLTINTKETENLPAYDKKLFYLDSFFKRMVYSDASKRLTTYSNFYYKDEDGKIYYWHRKRKGRYAALIDGSIIYLGAEATMYRATKNCYTSLDGYNARNLIMHSFLNEVAYYTVRGSSKFDDNENFYIAESEDGTLIEPRLMLREEKDVYKSAYLDTKKFFQSNNVNKIGHFIREWWKKEDEQSNNRIKIFCHNYDGLNYKIDLVVQTSDDIEDPQHLGPSFVSDKFPLCYYVDRIIFDNNGGTYKSEYDIYDECQKAFGSPYSFNPSCTYVNRKLYNANTKSYVELPSLTELFGDYIYYYNINSPTINDAPLAWNINSISNEFLKLLCIVYNINIIGICPNGNVLISIIPYQTNRSARGEYDNFGKYPEYEQYKNTLSPVLYYVLDFNSGKLEKSNIKEDPLYDFRTHTVGTYYDYWTPSTNNLPTGLYSDDTYLWFRKPYKDDIDITFYGTKDGYNIDKRITYYNRTTIPYSYKSWNGNTYNGNLSKNDLKKQYIYSVPVYEDGKFFKTMVAIWLVDQHEYDGTILIANDLTPNKNGIFEPLWYKPNNYNVDKDLYIVEQSHKQPDQTDDDYIYDIE